MPRKLLHTALLLLVALFSYADEKRHIVSFEKV